MSIRSNQKARLVEILQTIQYDNVNIVVTSFYQANPISYPYFYIQSGEIDTEILSNDRYKFFYTYYITLAFDLEMAVDQVNVDNIEEEFIDRLTAMSTRDSNSEVWQDLKVTNVSSMGQSDINIEDNIVLKVFTIRVETLPNYN